MARELEIVINMKIKFLFFYVLISSLFIGCAEEVDCFVADSVAKVRAVSVNNKTYYVYLRTSGFSEKEHFYELYKNEPKFDDCGKSNSRPISEAHIDTTRGNMSKLIIKDSQIKVIYSKDTPQIVNYKNVQIDAK